MPVLDRARRPSGPTSGRPETCLWRGPGLLLTAGWFLCLASVALGADVRRIPISGEPLEDLLARTDRPAVAAAIVHAEPFPEADAWIIDEVLFGSVGAGKSLDFSKCSPVLRVGSTPKYIRSLVAAAPVAEGEVEKHRVLVLPPGRRLTDFAAPRRSDRFLLLFEPRAGSGWAFAVQTVGDIYLLRGERVFRTAWVQHDLHSTIDWEMIWAPVGDTSVTALLERVRARRGARDRIGRPDLSARTRGAAQRTLQ